MPRSQAALLELVDSESDDGLGDILGAAHTSASPSRDPMPPAKRARGRPPAAAAAAAHKVTKPSTKSPTARRTSDRLAAAVEKAAAPEGERPALVEKSSNPQPPAGRGRGRRKAAAVDDDAEEDALGAPATTSARPARGRPPKKTAPAEQPSTARPLAKRGRNPAGQSPEEDVGGAEIPETQQPDHAVEPSTLDVDMEVSAQATTDHFASLDNDSPRLAPPPPLVSPERADRSPSRRRAHTPADEAALRRRLGELTRRYDALEARYRDLREVAVRDADRNFERLRARADERAAAADQLVARLREEAERAGREAAERARAEMAEALAAARAEAKTLATRLAAARSAAPAGGGVGGGGGAAAAGMSVGSAGLMQMKEDLYGDLTGLIVRAVKREGGEDVFDCIQTGRNGTLHFKLSIANDAASSEAFDDAQYLYMPQLDPARDADLIAVLPDYLVEEISFPRAHAAKFYARVMKSLNERPEE